MDVFANSDAIKQLITQVAQLQLPTLPPQQAIWAVSPIIAGLCQDPNWLYDFTHRHASDLVVHQRNLLSAEN